MKEKELTQLLLNLIDKYPHRLKTDSQIKSFINQLTPQKKLQLSCRVLDVSSLAYNHLADIARYHEYSRRNELYIPAECPKLETIEDLLGIGSKFLLQKRNLGKQTIAQIQSALSELGIEPNLE